MFPEITQFEKWLRRKSPQASTPVHYTSDLKHFFEWAQTAPDKITVRKVDEYIEYCQIAGYAVATINRRLTALNTFYQFMALESDEAPSNPMIPKRHYITQDERLPRDASDAEIEKLFSVIHDPRDRAIFSLMVNCGLRVGEVRNLSMQDLFLKPPANAQESLARIRIRGKGSIERTVYLSASTLETLQAWIAVRPESLDKAVFLNQHGKHMTVNGIQARLVGHCEEAKIWITCHQLRHTFGRRLVEARVPVTTIQKLMGHAWLRTTQIYMHVSDQQVQDDFRSAIEEISRRVSSPGDSK